MAYQAVFSRSELKYLITPAQQAAVLAAMAPHMTPDPYGRSTIRSIYYDTPDHRLVRHSIAKPVYKEKLRLRAYRPAAPDTPVFVELKKKYDHVVYKRRLEMGLDDALAWLGGDRSRAHDSQIGREIGYFLEFYRDLRPAVFLSYDREAWHAPGFRVTFDENVLCRLENISLDAPIGGTALLPEGKILMEIKCAGAIPLWLTGILTRERIFRTSFSKYGEAYKTMIFKGDKTYA